MSAIPVIECCFKYSSRPPSERQLEWSPRRLTYDEPSDLGHRGLPILDVHAIVADQRVRHGDELTRVGRIGQNLLIARHARVEDHFAKGQARSAKEGSVETASVLEKQVGRAIQRSSLAGGRRTGESAKATGVSDAVKPGFRPSPGEKTTPLGWAAPTPRAPRFSPTSHAAPAFGYALRPRRRVVPRQPVPDALEPWRSRGSRRDLEGAVLGSGTTTGSPSPTRPTTGWRSGAGSRS